MLEDGRPAVLVEHAQDILMILVLGSDEALLTEHTELRVAEPMSGLGAEQVGSLAFLDRLQSIRCDAEEQSRTVRTASALPRNTSRPNGVSRLGSKASDVSLKRSCNR